MPNKRRRSTISSPLPDVMWSCVFQYLECREMLLTVRTVNRSFNMLVFSPNSWDFVGDSHIMASHRYRIPMTALTKRLWDKKRKKKIQIYPEDLWSQASQWKFTSAFDITDDVLLRLTIPSTLRELVIESQIGITSEALLRVIRLLPPKIERLEFNTLFETKPETQINPCLKAIVETVPHLLRLSLRDIILNDESLTYLEHLSDLEHLDLSMFWQAPAVSIRGLTRFIEKPHPKLLYLYLAGYPSLRSLNFQSCPNLKALSLERMVEISETQIGLLMYHTHLRILDLGWTGRIDDLLLEILTDRSPDLKSLVFCPAFATINGFIRLLKLRNLTHLGFTSATDVSALAAFFQSLNVCPFPDLHYFEIRVMREVLGVPELVESIRKHYHRSLSVIVNLMSRDQTYIDQQATALLDIKRRYQGYGTTRFGLFSPIRPQIPDEGKELPWYNVNYIASNICKLIVRPTP